MLQGPLDDLTRTWLHRSLACTLAVGALLGLLVAARPGYTAFYLGSTLAFLLAGLLWAPSGPPSRGRTERVAPTPSARLPRPPAPRTYRVSA